MRFIRSSPLQKSLLLFAAMCLLYGLSAGANFAQQSLAPHYISLANAFLQGRADVGQVGLSIDVIEYDGKLFVPSPPMPAVLLMPLVALLTTTFSDILFSIILGAVNVTLVQHIFRKPWLTLFFAFGTSHWYFSALGSVWFQAQATAILFMLLSLWAAQTKQRSLLAGLLWGCALLARPPILFGALFPLFLLLTPSHHKRPTMRHTVILFSLPIVLSLLLLAVYNMVRFGDWLDFGYAYMLAAPNLVAAIEQHGTFGLEYLGCNLRVSLLTPPVVLNNVSAELLAACEHIVPNRELLLEPKLIQLNPIGMSIFLASPLLILLPVGSKWDVKSGILWLSLLAVMLPNWLLHNTGSLQFGYRYWMDAAPFWLALLAGIDTKQASQPAYLSALFKVLAILSVAAHVWGVGWMYQHFEGIAWAEAVRQLWGG